MNITDLHRPFPANEIEWRVGSTNADKSKGLALAYLTARHVMERLDEVCGPENWQDRYEFHGSRTVCYLSIRIGDEWVTKADGAGDSDVEAEKGAISDALKRAAVKWGVGRYLYNAADIWVEIEPAGRSFRIKKMEYAKLESALARQFGSGAPALDAPDDRHALEQRAFTHRFAIRDASDLEALQKLFGAAWKDITDTTLRAEIKAEYEGRKAALTQPMIETKLGEKAA